VGPLYCDRARKLFAPFDPVEIVLPDGEAHKTLSDLDRIFDALLAHRCDRKTTIVALGGGVVGDMAGFAAATYQRGVPFIQIPTTLLAQVDSSVGGKTGVNHPRGKNMIGAFWQPNCVLIDTHVLSTLPDRELSAGIAEVIKYGLIRDTAFLTWLEANMPKLLARDAAALTHAIETSCRHKAEVVAADEREAGQRALLNLGHTFGHAIETHAGYGSWLHGEAIAAGMVLAARFSERLGWIGKSDVERISRLITAARLPVSPPGDLTPTRWLELMSVDKKVQGGKLRFVLLKALGYAVVTDDFPLASLSGMLAEIQAAA
jgi:3-dehydroquinate synthase